MTQADTLRLVASLFLVVAIILAGAWAARRSGWLRANQGRNIRLLGTQSLGARAYVSIVEVEDARLVVGVTGNQVSLLHTMPRSASADEAPIPQISPQPSFSGLLARVASRRGS
jgi:flagellar protein FliO/FliZ